MAKEILQRPDRTVELSDHSTIVILSDDDVCEAEFVSLLGAPPQDVWDQISTMEGVKAELWPLLRMTHPKEMDRLDPEVVPIGTRAFRSWLLLFGLLPIDYDDLTFSEIIPGEVFEEGAPTFSLRTWTHRRTVHEVPGGTRITDQLRFAPRFDLAAPVLRRLLVMLFRWRHRRLRRAYPFPMEVGDQRSPEPDVVRLDPLNPPENKRRALDFSSVRMRRVDEALGEHRIAKVCEVMSALMAFGNSTFGLGRHLRAIEVLRQEQVLTLLVQASCEIETGFNGMRLGNVAAAYRGGRIAAELIAMAVLVSFPREVVMAAIEAEVEDGSRALLLGPAKGLKKLLAEYPEASVFDFWLAPVENGQVVGAPKLKAHDVVQLALCVGRHAIGVSDELLNEMLEFRRDAQHPASHGSAQGWAVGLAATDGYTLGIQYEPGRDDIYRQGADDLVGVVGAWVDLLTAVERYVVPPEDGGGEVSRNGH